MAKKATKKKSIKKNSSKKKQVSKPAEKKKVSFGPAIIKTYLENPGITNVAIAAKVGCTESAVRHYISRNGKFRDIVEKAIAEHYGREIFTLQGKAFKRLHGLLDDPLTPAPVLATVCKFLLEKWIVTDKEEEVENDVWEFETVISDGGTIQQIKRKVSERKKTITKGGMKEDEGDDWEDVIDV